MALDLAGIRPFDLGAANYGGPHPRTKDNPLRDLLLTPDTCVIDGLDAADITGYDRWRAYRTIDPIDPTLGELDDPMRINLFFISQMDDTEPRGSLVIITGAWDDTTTNGIPDHYRSATRLVLRYAIVMAIVGLLAGVAFQESAKKLEFDTSQLIFVNQ